jgi:uncharacterized protein YndB with AHSA1/START domain
VALHNVRILHESIDAPPARVYAFIADPANMPHWAPNFGHRITRDGDAWVMETADGAFRVRFAPDNDMGVLDHWVTPPGGAEIHNPMRVVANGTGSVISFTLVQQGDWSDEQLAADAGLVAADLARLKSIIEAESTPTS